MIQASTQLCASEARTTCKPVMGLKTPLWNPVTTREGIPRVRSITAMAEAKYSQCPFLRTNRKFASGSATGGR